MPRRYTGRQALIFPFSKRNDIPLSKGLYAFTIDVAQVARAIQKSGSWRGLERLRMGMVQELRNGVSINLAGRPTEFSQSLEFTTPAHRIAAPVPELQAEEVRTAGAILGSTQAFFPPVYIGRADSQTLDTRYSQHYRDYLKAKADPRLADAGGKFGHRVVARGLEWRDLVFACVPCGEEELRHLPLLEKILHALVNPGLSVSH